MKVIMEINGTARSGKSRIASYLALYTPGKTLVISDDSGVSAGTGIHRQAGCDPLWWNLDVAPRSPSLVDMNTFDLIIADGRKAVSLVRKENPSGSVILIHNAPPGSLGSRLRDAKYFKEWTVGIDGKVVPTITMVYRATEEEFNAMANNAVPVPSPSTEKVLDLTMKLGQQRKVMVVMTPTSYESEWTLLYGFALGAAGVPSTYGPSDRIAYKAANEVMEKLHGKRPEWTLPQLAELRDNAKMAYDKAWKEANPPAKSIEDIRKEGRLIGAQSRIILAGGGRIDFKCP